MKKAPQELSKQTNSGASKAYEDHVPASVPEAQESDSESVWAMFQQSIISTEERVEMAAELAAAKAKDDASARQNPQSDAPARDSGFADTNFAATNFSELPDDVTIPSPLKPPGS